jgi:tetratricopeptide (TPR) repeat protein
MHRFMLFVLLVVGGPAAWGEEWSWSDSDIKLMPPYCAARLHKDPSQEARWKQALGPDYLHSHHLCYGVGFINRAYAARSNRKRKSAADAAVGELNYVISHASPSFSLMPDVYMNRGIAYTMLKKSGPAIADFRKSIELQPTLVRSYTLLADLYLELNEKTEALKVATEGLRHVPGSKGLQELYTKLGGKLPYPEPIQAEAKAAPQPADASAGAAAPAAAVDTQAASTTAEEADASQQKASAGAEPKRQPQVGTPTNPWCRFCPEQP